jgi:hypothetical protein
MFSRIRRIELVISAANNREFSKHFLLSIAVTRQEYDHYLSIRDPVLGWPPTDMSTSATSDRSGARRSLAFPETGNECVSLYGDSYTFSAEVSDNESWGNILAQRLGCRVGNFGVIAYGTDQVVLRFIANTKDSAPVTVLGIYADNLLRNVNQYRYFLTGGERLGLKPRFVLENGAPKLVPIPKLSFDEFQRALRKPETVWPNEYFLPGSKGGPVVWSFPYTLSLMKLLTSPHFFSLAWKRVHKQPTCYRLL